VLAFTTPTSCALALSVSTRQSEKCQNFVDFAPRAISGCGQGSVRAIQHGGRAESMNATRSGVLYCELSVIRKWCELGGQDTHLIVKIQVLI
jgi:hypothetical protein